MTELQCMMAGFPISDSTASTPSAMHITPESLLSFMKRETRNGLRNLADLLINIMNVIDLELPTDSGSNPAEIKG